MRIGSGSISWPSIRHVDASGRRLRRALDTATAAFAPRHCAGCDRVSASAICIACRAAIDAMPSPSGRPAPRAILAACIGNIAAYPYADPVARIIQRGKYAGETTALRRIARSAAAVIGVDWTRPSVLVPVPLSRRRLRTRGYNQALIVAREFGSQWRVPVVDAAVRVRDTPSQVAHDQRRRGANVAGAFRWDGSALADGPIWIVDDVVTTGATGAALGTALRQRVGSKVAIELVTIAATA